MVYSKVYLDDLKKVCDIIPDIEYLKDKTILITGANGLICSALVDMLIELNSIKKLGITIYICARSQEKSQERVILLQQTSLVSYQIVRVRIQKYLKSS